MTRVRLVIDGLGVDVPAGSTVAAALGLGGVHGSRRSVTGQPRAAFCGMGICHECAVLIDGRRRLACQTPCRPGMVVVTASRTADAKGAR
jgi:predicted molibdopterin-dependent oxidoreductase YjgC